MCEQALSAILGGDGNANDAPPPYANVVGGQAVGVANVSSSKSFD